MALDDRTAHGQSDSHSVILRRVERFKKLVHRLRVETNSLILHGQADMIAFVPFGSDHQLPGAIVYGAHRV